MDNSRYSREVQAVIRRTIAHGRLSRHDTTVLATHAAEIGDTTTFMHDLVTEAQAQAGRGGPVPLNTTAEHRRAVLDALRASTDAR